MKICKERNKKKINKIQQCGRAATEHLFWIPEGFVSSRESTEKTKIQIEPATRRKKNKNIEAFIMEIIEWDGKHLDEDLKEN